MPGADRKAVRQGKGAVPAAGQRLLNAYTGLASRGEHLLEGVLGGQPPRQWLHYPKDDAIGADLGYQWFYHSHSPGERPDGAEHGHVHLFARRPLWARRMQSRQEKAFAILTGNPLKRVNTRHLLGVGLNAKGLPVSLFTVNGWVTGDLMLSASLTELLLAQMTLDTRYPVIDAVLESVVALCRDDVCQLLAARDTALASGPASGVLDDRRLEVLSSIEIDLDRKLES